MHEEEQLLQLRTDDLFSHLWISCCDNGDKDLDKDDCGENLDEYGDEENTEKNLLLGERLEKVQPQGGVPIVRRTLGALVVFCLLIFEKPWMQGKGLNLVGLI